MPTDSPRRQVRTWLREQIADQTEVEIAVLYRRMIAHFAEDPTFVRAWLAETLPAVAYEETRSIVGDTRGGHVLFGDVLLSREATDRRLAASRPRWQLWLEHVGDRHVRLVEMTRNDLLAAASIRRERGETEIRYAELWEELASRLSGKKRVGDVFTSEEIDALARSLRIQIEVQRGVIVTEKQPQ